MLCPGTGRVIAGDPSVPLPRRADLGVAHERLTRRLIQLRWTGASRLTQLKALDPVGDSGQATGE